MRTVKSKPASSARARTVLTSDRLLFPGNVSVSDFVDFWEELTGERLTQDNINALLRILAEAQQSGEND